MLQKSVDNKTVKNVPATFQDKSRMPCLQVTSVLSVSSYVALRAVECNVPETIDRV
jgi:hypothetical protein